MEFKHSIMHISTLKPIVILKYHMFMSSLNPVKVLRCKLRNVSKSSKLNAALVGEATFEPELNPKQN